MTELNSVPETEAAGQPLGTATGTAAGTAGGIPAGANRGTAAARVDWPVLPAGAAGRDPDVESLLERLGTLPALPVSDHGEVYAGLHHGLLEALNEAGDPAS
ncbi:hypothetical protein QFZ79_004202 [Arthrobacter sp. V4I6]|uniref:hypothetical protein n=1 Tax=unclassified Arthrobacter TaxID=235627 RepID=UPI002784F4E1|nr:MULTISPECIES: hypothetical protein [unclassified Arthrobacter]MDQ0821825.1 hypothetical protein [Arthrobacter sp. V1I7]MDQ0856091.1 hypothetical protein [Arthrobacter sp. V4I6]